MLGRPWLRIALMGLFAFATTVSRRSAADEPSSPLDEFVGAFQRTVPIAVPPFHGIEPKLSLAYDSSVGDGFVGVGWRLKGFSTIQRASPGGGAPNWDGNDVFLLDGVELVPCAAGSRSPSCITGGTHSTKIENYERITFGNGWEVWKRDGTQLLYESFARGGVGGAFWGLTAACDSHGNVVSYSWDCGDGQDCYPLTVSYNGNWIGLHREARPDVVTFAAGGGEGSTNGRLMSVEVQAAGQRVHTYQLDYETSPSTSSSLLASVQEFGTDATLDGTGRVTGGTSAPPTWFSYYDAPNDFVSSRWATWQGGYPGTFVTGDFDGNGQTDFAQYWNCNYQLCLDVHPSNGSSFGGQRWATEQGGYLPPNYSASIVTGDFNGDGKTDFAQYWNDPGGSTGWTADVHVSNGSSFDIERWATWQGGFPGTFVTGDFDGNGQTDFAQYWNCNGQLCVDVHPSTGSSFGWERWATEQGGYLPPNYGAAIVTGDFNGDGKTDFAQYWNCNGQLCIDVHPSTGNGFGWERWATEQGGFLPPYYGANIVTGDFNGDGKTDFAQYWNDPGGSTGWTVDAHLSTGSSFVIQRWATWQGGYVGAWATGDFNGDGRIDFAQYWNCNGQLCIDVHPSTGSSFLWQRWATMQGGYLPPNFSAAIVTGDFNGDGKTDFAQDWNDPSGPTGWTADVHLSAPGANDLMSIASTGIGGTTTIAYQPSSSWPNANDPPVAQTVTAITESDGRGWVATTSYSYAGGLYDAIDRRFLGFHYVAERQPAIGNESQGPLRETWFAQDYGSVSKPQQINVSAGSGAPLTTTVFQYQTNGSSLPYTSLETGTQKIDWGPPGPCPSGPLPQGAVPMPCNVSESTYTSHSYDGYANDTADVYWGDTAVTGDEKNTQNFFYPNTQAFIVGMMGATNTWAGTTPGGTLLEQTLYEYDGASSFWTPPTAGNRTATLRWLDTYNSYVATGATYDQAGNVVKTTDALGNTTTTQYDSTRVYPTGVTNALGQSSTTQWNTACGLPSLVIDANGQQTSMQYDPLCRPTRTSTPLGGYKTISYNNVGNPNNTTWPAPNGQYTEVDTPSADGNGPQWTRTFFDGLGRTYFTQSKGPRVGREIYSMVTFDARGNVNLNRPPWFGGDNWTNPTTYSYDALNRLTSTVNPDGSATSVMYAPSTMPWTTTSVDTVGHAVTSISDAYGHVVRRTESSNGQPLVTSYLYDLRGNPTVITDALGNLWSFTVDSLGRKVRTQDPDTGIWSYSYDADGREVFHTDALGQLTTFGYDALGRTTSRTSAANTAQAKTVAWTYDQPGAGWFNVGRLTTVNNPLGSQQADYDALGRLVAAVTTVDGKTFTTSTVYDAGGRTSSVTYPDGEQVTTLYDGAGAVVSVPGYVTSATYDAAGNLASQTNANGTTSTYAYSPTRQWLTSFTTTSGANVRQQSQLTRDAEGKITAITSPLAHESWSYVYDDLKRLITAQSQTDGTQTFAYDYVGNMTYNSLVGGYSYPPAGQPRPHAVSATAAGAFSYDANGNMLTDASGRTYGYDATNHLAGVQGEAFFYDPDGARIKKVSGGVTTYYVGGGVEVTGGVFKKRLSLAGHLVAETDGGARYWLHTDDKGSLVSVSDAYGSEVQRYEYRPLGDQLSREGAGYPETHGYVGEELDDSGLLFLNARYYDPKLGRFTSADPLPKPTSSGLNRYAYADDDPVNHSDPSGRFDFSPDMGFTISPDPFAGVLGDTAGTEAFFAAAATLNQAPEFDITKPIAQGRGIATDPAGRSIAGPQAFLSLSTYLPCGICTSNGTLMANHYLTEDQYVEQLQERYITASVDDGAVDYAGGYIDFLATSRTPFEDEFGLGETHFAAGDASAQSSVLPDTYSAGVAVGVPGIPALGIGVTGTVTRYGGLYGSVTGGPGLAPVVAGQASLGYVLSGEGGRANSEQQLNAYLTGPGVGFSAVAGGGITYGFAPGSKTVAIGPAFGTPQIGGSASFGSYLFNPFRAAYQFFFPTSFREQAYGPLVGDRVDY
jgi:RHS repeat-associated protein